MHYVRVRTKSVGVMPHPYTDIPLSVVNLAAFLVANGLHMPGHTESPVSRVKPGLELDITNRLYLELSQVATAQTKRELDLLDMLKRANGITRSMFQVCMREGQETAWPELTESVRLILKEQHATLYPTSPAL